MVNMMDSILENRKIVERYCLFDDLMMSKTFEDFNCVSYLLGTIFHRDDLEIVDVRSQFEVRNLQGKSIRLDIFAIDKNGVIYDIEVQRDNSHANPQRARYYSSMIDGNILDKGNSHYRRTASEGCLYKGTCNGLIFDKQLCRPPYGKEAYGGGCCTEQYKNHIKIFSDIGIGNIPKHQKR